MQANLIAILPNSQRPPINPLSVLPVAGDHHSDECDVLLYQLLVAFMRLNALPILPEPSY
jgi:hypothetical protein